MRKLGFVAAFVLAAAALTAALASATEGGKSRAEMLKAAKAANARFVSVEQAVKAGYSGKNEPCVTAPPPPNAHGAMGIHYVNGPVVADDAIDPLGPEILLYLPGKDGKLKLVGVEYFKVAADQTPDKFGRLDDSDRPTVFGRPLDGPMPGHNPTMPYHYDLHVWFWKPNPSGFFAPFNPGIACPPAKPSAATADK